MLHSGPKSLNAILKHKPSCGRVPRTDANSSKIQNHQWARGSDLVFKINLELYYI